MTPKLDIEMADEIPGVKEGKTYFITTVEQFTSQVRNYKGLRITLKDTKGNEAVEALWLRSPVGAQSKLGSFMTKLGKDTDTWINRKIKVLKWKTGDREIEVIK